MNTYDFIHLIYNTLHIIKILKYSKVNNYQDA